MPNNESEYEEEENSSRGKAAGTGRGFGRRSGQGGQEGAGQAPDWCKCRNWVVMPTQEENKLHKHSAPLHFNSTTFLQLVLDPNVLDLQEQ